MSREKRLPDGSLPKERMFAQLICKGMRPRDAYRQAGYGSRGADKHVNDAALRKAKEPRIVMLMTDWLRQARISDIDSPGEAVSDVKLAFHRAMDLDNLTAAAALGRLRFQANGIAEKTMISIEAVISDDDLLRRIAGDDVQKLGLLTSLLTDQTFSHGEKQPLLIEGTADEDE